MSEDARVEEQVSEVAVQSEVTGDLTSVPDFFRDLAPEPQPSNKEVQAVISETQHLSGIQATYSTVGVALASILASASAAQILDAYSSIFYGIIGGLGSIGIISPSTAPSAREITSVYYVNFPTSMSQSQLALLRDYRQNMDDFRCWSSLKWWQETTRLVGQGSDIESRMTQNYFFARIACEDMVRMSWLQSTRSPSNVNYSLECSLASLHADILRAVLVSFIRVDDEVLRAVDPVLQDIARSANANQTRGRDLRTIITDKFEYVASSNSIRSYTRLISFMLSESFYDVSTGKNSSERRVRCDMNLLEYEALFRIDLWRPFSAQLQEEQKKAMEDFVNGNSYDIPV